MKGEGIIGAADTVTKAYIRKNEVFADAFNYFMYDGRQKIQPEQLRELDSTEIAILLNEKDTKDKTNKEKEASEQKMVQKYRDLLKTATIMEDGEATYVLLGIENQTEVHYAMPVRNMLYDAMQYNQQVTEIAEKHKGKKGGKRQQKISTGEFLSGFYKNNKLIPVITLVLFFNPGEWDGPRSLFDMLDISNPIFKKYAQDYKIHIISPKEILESDLKKFSSSLREVIGCIKYSNDKNRLADQYFNLVLNTIYEVLKSAKNQILQENINSLYAEVIEEFACWLKNYCINEEIAENKKLKNNKIYNINKPEDYATAVVEYIAGMTDNKAIDTYNKIISF